MTLSANQHKAIAIILFLSLTVFLRLGSGEMQPNEEGSNAMHAKEILQSGNNLNQIIRSDSGMSLTPKPPLVIWVITGSMAVFGENAFSVRLFTALCSAMALAFLFLISRRFLTYTSSVAALFLISGTIAWNNYSRLGMADIPAIAFILASLFFVLKTLESEGKKQFIIFSLLFGLSLFCAIMTKAVVWLLPLIFIAFLFRKKDKKLHIRFLLIASILAIILSLIYYRFLSVKNGSGYGDSITQQMAVFDFNNFTLPGILNFINQIIISNPFIIFAFILIVFGFRKINKLSGNMEHGKYLNYIISFWFLLAFIISSVIFLNYPNSIIYLLPPAILLSLKFYDNFHHIIKSNKILWILVTVLIALFLWSFIFEFRQEVIRLFTGQQYSFYALLFLILIVVSILCAFLIPKKLLDKFAHSGLYYSVTLLPYLMIFKVILLNLTSPTGDSFGAVRTADILQASDSKSFVYLYHESTPADSINTQLDWYTDGWLSGWRKGKSCIHIKQPKDYVDYENLSKTYNFPDLFVVYYIHRNISIKTAIMKELYLTRSILLRKNNYVIFGRVNTEQIPDKPI